MEKFLKIKILLFPIFFLEIFLFQSVLAERVTIQPNGDAVWGLAQWPASGFHYEKVDDPIDHPDDTSTVVYRCGLCSVWIDNYDLYYFPNSYQSEIRKADKSGIINWVKVFFRVRRDQGDSILFYSKIKIGNGLYDGGGCAPELSSNYHNCSGTFSQSPATNSIWTWDELSNLQAGVHLKGLPICGPQTCGSCTQLYLTIDYLPITLPKVRTLPVSDIGPDRGTLNAEITDLGGAPSIVERGFEWGTSPGNYTQSWTETGNFGTGSFSKTITGLTLGQTYYFRAKVRNNPSDPNFWAYGEELSFIPSHPCGTFDHNVFGYAWSSNIGWISFNCQNCNQTPKPEGCPAGTIPDYGVNLQSDPIDSNKAIFSGYAWSSNIGWISFNQADLSGCPFPPCRAWVDISACSENKCPVFGWAKALAGGTPEAGGWEGWIRLKDQKYGAWIDLATSPAQFHDWAWGSDVIGWISFNHLNCDSDGDGLSDTGNYSQCPVGQPVPDYKVWTTFSFNRPPHQPDQLAEDFGDLCEYRGQPVLSWRYRDDDGDPQDSYQVLIDNNSDFSSPEVDSCIPALSGGVNTCQAGNSSPSYTPPILAWNTTYHWKVKVKDDKGNWSAWSDSKRFDTPAHAYPSPDFDPSPANPRQGEEVTFLDRSKCYQAPGNSEYYCKTGGALISYHWDFGDGAISDSKGDVSHIFGSVQFFQVRLTITDDSVSPRLSCSKTKTIGILPPYPKWKEIPPF